MFVRLVLVISLLFPAAACAGITLYSNDVDISGFLLSEISSDNFDFSKVYKDILLEEKYYSKFVVENSKPNKTALIAFRDKYLSLHRGPPFFVPLDFILSSNNYSFEDGLYEIRPLSGNQWFELSNHQYRGLPKTFHLEIPDFSLPDKVEVSGHTMWRMRSHDANFTMLQKGTLCLSLLLELSRLDGQGNYRARPVNGLIKTSCDREATILLELNYE